MLYAPPNMLYAPPSMLYALKSTRSAKADGMPSIPYGRPIMISKRFSGLHPGG
jgi:hypothetical protein